MKRGQGQVIIILLLVVVIALGVGLTVVGRSITEISTSTKTEDSTRAFSAAEAGIERALSESYNAGGAGVGGVGNIPLNSTDLTNQSQFKADWNPQLPEPRVALEYPPFGKESFAQFWLADPNSPPGEIPAQSYNQS
ncbi:MAG: hypothetical protein UW79_C0007G0001, partial [Candidatus Yanofskybacteria bacterium GW2011_GWA2_44_9]